MNDLSKKLTLFVLICLLAHLLIACGSSNRRETQRQEEKVVSTDTVPTDTVPTNTVPTNTGQAEPTPAVVGREPTATPEEIAIRSPQEMWASLACSACHMLDMDQTERNRGPVGPHMGNYPDRAGDRVAGMSAAAYTYMSIVDPEAFITEGYSPVMPKNFTEKMSEDEIQAMVSWLLDPAREQ